MRCLRVPLIGPRLSWDEAAGHPLHVVAESPHKNESQSCNTPHFLRRGASRLIVEGGGGALAEHVHKQVHHEALCVQQDNAVPDDADLKSYAWWQLRHELRRQGTFREAGGEWLSARELLGNPRGKPLPCVGVVGIISYDEIALRSSEPGRG